LYWAYWHLPVNLSGYNDATHPVWTAFVLFPFGVTCMALALGWLVRRTGSVWPAALAHGAHNTLAGGLGLAPRDWWADTAANGVAAAVLGICFGVLLRRAKKMSISAPAPVVWEERRSL